MCECVYHALTFNSCDKEPNIGLIHTHTHTHTDTHTNILTHIFSTLSINARAP